MPRFRLPLILLAALFAAGCANIGPPPGGPEDETGPELVSFYPEAGAVNVERDMVVTFEFSELVNRPSVESAIFMSPDPIRRLRYKWSGKTLRLVYMDPLEEDRTYVVSLGSEAKDLHGNPAAKTTTIAFSTGNKLDEATFHGWVRGAENLSAFSIWAFPIPSLRDPDPALDTAAYRIQANADGSFIFTYLREGPYRVFAVNDRNHDGFWNPAAEPLGPPPWDLFLREGEDPWISLLPVSHDTSAVEVHRVRHIEDRRFDVRLSRVVDSLRCELSDSLGNTLHLQTAYFHRDEPVLWTLFTEELPSPGEWSANCELVDSTGTHFFDRDTLRVSERPDTTKPALINATPGERARVVAPGSVLLEFDEPLNVQPGLDSTARVIGREDTITVISTLDGERYLGFVFPARIDSGGRYTLEFDATLVTDLSGNPASDTTLAYSFTVLPKDSLGTIVGNLSTSIGGRYLVYLTEPGETEPMRAELIAAGPYRIESLPAGKYLLTIAHDINRDAKLTPGAMFPFEFSEPYEQLADTILVRARWESAFDINWTPTIE